MLASNSVNGINLQPVVTSEESVLEKELFAVAEIDSRLTNRVDRYRAFMDKTFLFNKAGVERYVDGAKVNMDDNQILQYSSGRTYYRGIACSNYSFSFKLAEAEDALNQILSRLPVNQSLNGATGAVGASGAAATPVSN